MRSSNGGNPAGSKNSGDDDDADDDHDVCVGRREDDNALYTATQCDPGSSLSS